MDAQPKKLSPSEFLAALKQESAQTPRASVSEAPDTAGLELDFSDLEAPAAKTDRASLPMKSAAAARESSRGKPGETSAAPKKPEAAGRKSEPPAAGAKPDVVKADAHISALFDRVNSLLGGATPQADAQYFPRAPESLEEAGLPAADVERLILKYLLSRGSASGRMIAGQVCLPFQIVDPLLRSLKQEQLVVFKGAAAVGDYEYTLTDNGRERARRYMAECTYFGAATVTLKDYLKAMEAQSIAKQHATEADLKHAFSDLIINQKMFDRLGPAINSGRGMFLFGEPGNGKTSIAERITGCFGSTIWVPRALGIDGDIVRIFDPGVHEEIRPTQQQDGLFDLSNVDTRWVRIRRPTVIAGGELTMSELEVKQNLVTKICEAPLQLKSNCGTFVIDDFGRQRMPVEELLNRWIVPLEKRYDFLNLPCGKKVQVPFDQLIIFSTNLEPKDLVDGAFLRRIPYKIEVPDPSVDEFRKLFEVMAPHQGFQFDRAAVDYLIETHYLAKNRPFRACQPRDLLLQVKNYCLYKSLPKVMTPEAFDFACDNYFSVL
jgi:hypothetical protein